MKALEIMTTGVVTVQSEASVREAARLMLEHRVSGLPVVDDVGRLAGIVTEGDFLRRAETGTELRHPRWLEFLLGLDDSRTSMCTRMAARLEKS